MSNSDRTGNEDERWESWLADVDISEDAPPPATQERALATIDQLILARQPQMVESNLHATGGHSPRVILKRLSWAALAASLLFTVSWLLVGSQSEIVAQLQSALREQKWIRLSGRNAAGQQVDEWLSDSEKIYAVKQPDLMLIEDHQAGKFTQRLPDGKRLLEGPINRAARMSLGTMIYQIARDGVKVGSVIDGATVKRINRQRTKINGQAVEEFQLTLAAADQSTFQAKLLIDPQNSLPFELVVTAGGRSRTVDVSYPEQGPRTIYDLGVERDLPVLTMREFRPLNTDAQMQSIADNYRLGQEFDDYWAVFCVAPDVPYRVLTYRGGTWRLEGCVQRSDQPLELPAAGQARTRDWWHQRLQQVDRTVLAEFDGSTLTRGGEAVEADEPLDARQAALLHGEAAAWLLQTLVAPPIAHWQPAAPPAGGPTQGTGHVEPAGESMTIAWEAAEEQGVRRVAWACFPTSNLPVLTTSRPWAAADLDPQRGHIALKLRQTLPPPAGAGFLHPRRSHWWISTVPEFLRSTEPTENSTQGAAEPNQPVASASVDGGGGKKTDTGPQSPSETDTVNPAAGSSLADAEPSPQNYELSVVTLATAATPRGFRYPTRLRYKLTASDGASQAPQEVLVFAFFAAE